LATTSSRCRDLSRIYYNGRFFDYPLRAGNALRSLGPWNAALIVLSYLKWHYRRIRPWKLRAVVTNHFGKRLYEILLQTYTEKVWGVPCTEIRAEWAAQRIQGLSLARAILNAVALNKRSTTIKSLIHEFQYPRLGPGQMWGSLQRADCLDGQPRCCSATAFVGVDTRDGRVTAVRTETPNGERRFSAEHFISTTDIRGLVRGCVPRRPPPSSRRRGAEVTRLWSSRSC